MKLSLFTTCALLALGPVGAHANGRANHPLPADAGPTALKVLPVGIDPAEPRAAGSLRDSLRQHTDDAEYKPYRLSSEERVRMREQLRSQSFPESSRK